MNTLSLTLILLTKYIIMSSKTFTKRDAEVISEFMQFYSTQSINGELLNRLYWDDIMPVIKACNECPKDGKLDTAYEYALEDLDTAIYGDDITGAWKAIMPFIEYAVSLKINIKSEA